MRKLEYKQIVLVVTSLGVLMTGIDGTVVVLALPTIMADLHASLVEMVWVIMAYNLTTTALLLILGRLADMFGRVRMYNLGFSIFTAGSLLCGLAGTGHQLIFFRVVQGTGGALLLANAAAIVTEAFPPAERGRALGYNATFWAIGGTLGPILGGLALSRFTWRVLFLINVPIGIVGTLAAFHLLREIGERKTGEPFDLAGALLFTSALTALLLALTRGVSQGFFSPEILGLFACSVAAFLGFSAVERRAAVPVLDPALFANRVFGVAAVVGMLQSLAMFAVNFLMLYFLQAVQGKDPLTAALLVLPMPVLSSVAAVWAGRLSDRVGQRLPATAGLLCQTLAMGLLLRLSPSAGYPIIGAGLALVGLGAGLFWSPNMSAAMGASPPHRLGVAAGTVSTLRQAGMVTSFALAIFVAARSLPPQDIQSVFLGTAVHLGASQMSAFVLGMRSAFVVSAVITFVAAALSAARPNPHPPSLRQAVG